MPEFRLKRIYDKPCSDDGVRLLVDRLWPRGVSKESAQIDVWAKELTPSNELRKWFHNHTDQYADFVNRYRLELHERMDKIVALFSTLESSPITLVTSTKDLNRGHVAVLKNFLEGIS